MVPVSPPERDPTGPTTKPHIIQGIALEALSSSQNEQVCSQIMEDILSHVVSCSEEGSHGPTIGLTSCESATCSLGGVDPPADLALAISTLVSRNSRYVRKTMFNCGGCGTILKNTSYCACGTAQEFPSLLFKRTWKKSLALFTQLGKTSLNKIRTSPSESPPVGKDHIVPPRGVFAGLLSNTTGLATITSCSCFATVAPVSPSLENDDEDKLVLDTSGSLFLEHEVRIISHSII